MKLVLAITLAAGMPGLAAAQGVVAISGEDYREAPAPMSADLRACIESNASKVERAGEPISASIDLLVTKVCAEPLSVMNREQQTKAQEANKARMQKMCARMKASAKTDAEREATTFCDMYGDEDLEGGWAMSFAYSQNAPADATALAANLILELRTQRLEAKPQ